MPIERLTDLADPAAAPRVVFKVGSALLFGDGKADRDWLATLAGEIAEAHGRGQQVIVVSSGAIALGAAKLGLPKGGRGALADAQAAAAVGQIALAGLWSELLGEHGLTAAQLLLTLEDLEDRRRYLNAAATLGRLLKAGAVPVINENDSVATRAAALKLSVTLAPTSAPACGKAVLRLPEHQHGNQTGAHHGGRGAAEDELPNGAVTVSAHNEEIDGGGLDHTGDHLLCGAGLSRSGDLKAGCAQSRSHLVKRRSSFVIHVTGT